MKQGGLKPKVADERDFKLGALIDWPKLSDLPKEFRIEPLSIKDQIRDGLEDFCASAAVTGMIEPKEGVELYYPFLFAAAKFESKEPIDSWGLTLKEACQGVQKHGVLKATDVPSEIKSLSPKEKRNLLQYPAELRRLAKEHSASSYFEVKGPYDAFDDVRAAIWYFKDKKQLVLFGVEFGWPLFQNVLELKDNVGGFGHAMYVCGWNEKYLYAVNSAGPNAGDDGIHEIPRDTFNKYADQYGIMMLVDIPVGDAEYMLQNKIKIGENWLTLFWKVLRGLFS